MSRSSPSFCSGLCVWRVRYDSRFESSSGMDLYHIDHKDCTGLVVTREETLDAVRAAIAASLDSQSRLCVLHEAHYLGETLNDPNVQADLPATVDSASRKDVIAG